MKTIDKDHLRTRQGFSNWFVLYKLFSGRDYGFFRAFDEITSLTGLVRKQVYSSIPVVNEILEDQNKVLRNVWGKGYRVASPFEMHQPSKSNRKPNVFKQDQPHRHLRLVPPLSSIKNEEKVR